MKIKKLLCVGTAIALLAGCSASSASASASSDLQTYSNISLDSGFDTFFSLQETTADKDSFDAHFTSASALFSHYNQLFDIYNDYEGINNLKTINDNAGIQAVEVDPDIIEMLQKAKEFYDLSDGEFDVTMGCLLKVWHTYRENGIDANEDGEYGELPSDSELQEASVHSGWDKIEIDTENNTVYITDPDVSLDVGGIAKGFATEKIADVLEQDTILSAAVNAGGNNRTIHAKADGSNWRVGIQNPGGEGSLVTVSEYGSVSFVTSGDYERYYTASDGKNYNHIIDPQTLYPAVYYHSVTVITPNSADADCLSTTLFTMSYEDGLALIDTYKENHPDTELDVVWIMDPANKPDTQYAKDTGGYTVVYTSGLEGSLEWNAS